MAISRQSEALRVMSQHLQVDEEACRRLEENLDDESRPNWLLSHSRDMVLIDIFRDADSINLMNNIRYFMFMELIGMGPARYCTHFRPLHCGFVDYLTQVLTYLPRQKLFLYPRDPCFNYNAFLSDMRIWLRVLLRQPPTITEDEYWAHFGSLEPAAFEFAG